LLDSIHQNGGRLAARQKDMLLCCGETISAVTQYGNAQIISIDPDRILELLYQQKIVIVTGFVDNAKPLSHVTFNEISHLAHNGAKVFFPRAVEIVKHANLPVRIRSIFSQEAGTLVAGLEARSWNPIQL
jgi:aspartate kinase